MPTTVWRWCRYSRIRNKSISNYYILNLAAADELLLCTLPLYCVSTYTADWVFGEVVCRLSYVFRESNKYTGILTLVALSVDRCLASYPNVAAVRRVPVGVGVCVVIWMISLLVSLPYAINATVTAFNGHRSCRLVWRLTIDARRAWTFSQLVFALAVPLAVNAGANGILLWRLGRRSSRRLGRSRLNAAASSFGPLDMTRLVVIVVGVFVVCHLPYHVVEVMSLMTYERYSLHGGRPTASYRTAFIYVNTTAQLLVHVSSCCNPVIYGIFNKNYRKSFILTLLMDCQQLKMTDRYTEPCSR